MFESAIEKKINRLIKDLGGKAYKWVSPGAAGVPDRICVLPGGKIVFIEAKRPDVSDGLSLRQKKEALRLRKLGHVVLRVNDVEELKLELRGLGYEV